MKIKNLINSINFFRTLIIVFGIFNSTNLYSQGISVSIDDTWNTNSDISAGGNGQGYEEGIEIEEDVTLNISNLTLVMNENAEIILHRGARLNLNGTLITSEDPGNKFWNGIRSSNINCNGAVDPQFLSDANYPDPTTLNSTTAWSGNISGTKCPVVIIDNCTLSWAINAVFSTCGMIIKARNSSFTNNQTSITLSEYEPKPGWGANRTWQSQSNASFVMDCTFDWTDPAVNFSQMLGIKLQNVRGVRIGGCTFANSMGNDVCYSNRGRGISSQTAVFGLGMSGSVFSGNNSSLVCTNNDYPSGGPTSKRNLFRNLNVAIEISDEWEYNYPVRGILIRNADFENNFSSLKVLKFEYFKVVDCKFYNDRTLMQDLYGNSCGFSNSTTITQVDFNHAIDYEVYDNKFEFVGDHIIHLHQFGIYYNWKTSKIQKNEFKNGNTSIVASNIVTGIEVEEINSQLEITCNTFINMGTDIKVGGSNTIKSTQGNSTLGAGNVFSDLLNGRFRLNNQSGSTINYYWYQLGNIKYRPVSFASGETYLSEGISNVSASNNRETTSCDIACSDFRSSTEELITLRPKIILFPQPSSSSLNINILNNFESYINFDIFAYDGKIILSGEIQDPSNITLDINNFANGIYTIVFKNAENKCTYEKFLVLH